jgi:hypothetical protein
MMDTKMLYSGRHSMGCEKRAIMVMRETDGKGIKPHQKPQLDLE